LPVAIEVQLTSQTAAQQLSSYTSGQSGIKQTKVTVSGIASTRLDGTFQPTSTKFTGSLVIVPVRDTSILIWNQDTKYAAQYNQVLSQIKINP